MPLILLFDDDDLMRKSKASAKERFYIYGFVAVKV